MTRKASVPKSARLQTTQKTGMTQFGNGDKTSSVVSVVGEVSSSIFRTYLV